MRATFRLLPALTMLVTVLNAPVASGQTVSSQSATSGGELGRIFYDASQRQLLERSLIEENSPQAGDTETPVSSNLRFNGVMRMRGGRPSAWVNGTALEATNGSTGAGNTTGMKVELRGERLVVRRLSGQSVLRAGDSLDNPVVSPSPAGTTQ
jgi:hypothetical protein